jgi:hypothetical protein
VITLQEIYGLKLVITDIESYVNEQGKLVYILTLKEKGMTFRISKTFKDDSEASGYEIGKKVKLNVTIHDEIECFI